MNLYHNSQEEFYRNPFGAVSCGKSIILKLEARDCDETPEAFFNYISENQGMKTNRMSLSISEGNYKLFDFILDVGEKPQIILYYFAIKYKGKVYFYGNNCRKMGGRGKLFEEGPLPFQITVYKDFQVPKWYKASIIYQVFLDRFSRPENFNIAAYSGKNRLFHSNWNDKPVYIKDNKGDISYWDFFGGNLEGLNKKIDYLLELGVNLIYLNPIFEARSNHKYDTGDYKKIDPMYGSNEDFERIVNEFRNKGIRVILDGVFSHTGADSIYFNKESSYNAVGAYNSKESRYYPWYRFKSYPDEYEAWWGVKDLPNVDELEDSYKEFIYRGPESLVDFWGQKGISGWRLDVVDELPEEFLREFRVAVKKQNPENIVIGEVWEDASNKESYGKLRHYLLGEELDGTMNYVLRRIMLDFYENNTSGELVHMRIMNIFENYPKESFYSCMNLIGSHDVERILSVFGGKCNGEKLNEKEKVFATRKLKSLVSFQMCFPGVPAIYYGDEVGVEGGRDPDNRRTYPWGFEDLEILEIYKKLIKFRKESKVLIEGDFKSGYIGENIYYFSRKTEDEICICVLNRENRSESIELDAEFEGDFIEVLGERAITPLNGKIIDKLNPFSSKIYYKKKTKKLLNRSAGILCHVTSIKGDEVLGTLGPKVYEFIDFLNESNQKIWQILPLNEVDGYLSPYSSPNSLAGNYMLIDIESLKYKSDLSVKDILDVKKCKYGEYRQNKLKVLRKIYERFSKRKSNIDKLKTFFRENEDWLNEYLLYKLYEGMFREQWPKWPKGLVDKYFLDETEDYFWLYVQYVFDKQWNNIRKYARERDVKILGDLPFYVNYHSSDVWGNQEIFMLDEQGNQIAQSGVPPDYFNKGGQLWGNPIYNWGKMKENGFEYWVKRIDRALKLYDYVRVDHFRGLEAYFEVDAKAKTAVKGKWVKAKGIELLEIIEKKYPGRVIAEDLGFITDHVRYILEKFKIPGMDILQFKEGDYYGVGQKKDILYYSGTHDNQTLFSWIKSKFDIRKGMEKEVMEDFIRKIYASRANWIIIPIQDYLYLDNDARMNIPGTVENNWTWNMEFIRNFDLERNLAALANRYKRG